MEFRDYPNSSNVDRIAWYPSVETMEGADEIYVDVLTIRFKGKSTRPYAYWPVAPQQWEQLRDCKGSIGTLIQKAIIVPARRGEYMMTKLDGETLGASNAGAALQEAERETADAAAPAQSVTPTEAPAAPSVQTQPEAKRRPQRISKPG